MSPSEKGIIRLVREGDTEAFGELVASYQSSVYGIALSTIGDAEEAEDVAQTCFVEALEQFRARGCRRRRSFHGTTRGEATRPRRKTVTASVAVSAGSGDGCGRASLTWNARSLTDTRVPSGIYLLRLTARTEEGEQASAVTLLEVGR